jgi:hypothetical protein
MSEAASNPPSTGFIIVEKVLHEYRDRGKSATMAKFESEVSEGLARHAAGTKQPKAAKEIQTVEKAMASAKELIETIRQEAAAK